MPRWRRRQLKRQPVENRPAPLVAKNFPNLTKLPPVWVCDCLDRKKPNQQRCKKCRKRRPW